MSTAENNQAAAQSNLPPTPGRVNGSTSHSAADGGASDGSAPHSSASHSSAMFSGAPATMQAGGLKPETEQLNLRIRADLYRQLDRVSVILGARRGAPVNRVTIVEEALTAYFEANRTP